VFRGQGQILECGDLSPLWYCGLEFVETCGPEGCADVHRWSLTPQLLTNAFASLRRRVKSVFAPFVSSVLGTDLRPVPPCATPPGLAILTGITTQGGAARPLGYGV
jgi:hypothetical protein